ncbi:CapA family protein [Heliorestis acidaminivorans]|uniref:CapA family protein n=1 Tax=Heliorestis acidaminivorans TaxID=553427 RepID=A0A6I0F589_9FIRM|nr:CapA family protein [Heliorestis acidaminivorans]KAB2953847.1 CapA family protein [Heliorestis acidaminivorans]
MQNKHRKRLKKTYQIFAFVLLGSFVLFLSACAPLSANKDLTSPAISGTTVSQKGDFVSTNQEPYVPPTAKVTITATGDLIMHNTLIFSGRQSNGTYQFDHFFKEVEPLISLGDYGITNLEGTLAGESAGGYTGYPLFNAPDTLADAIKSAGFDMVTTANNHILDRGYQGALRTKRVLESAGLDTVGISETPEEREMHFIREFNGVKVGFLAYTYSTNGIPLPKDRPEFIAFVEKERIISDVQKLRPLCDLLVVLLHWGTEYSPEPSQGQRKLAQEIFSSGADMILGGHPHVIQPMEVMQIDGKDKFIIYSMGNFLADQRGLERNSGIVLTTSWEKNFDTKELRLLEVNYVPTYSHRYYEHQRMHLRVVPIEETMEKIKNKEEPFLTQKDLPTLQTVLDDTRRRLGPEYKAEAGRDL